MIAMIVIGCALIPFYILWDFKFASYPVIARRFLLNRSVIIACAVGAFDFVSRVGRLTLDIELMLKISGVVLYFIYLPILFRIGRKAMVSH